VVEMLGDFDETADLRDLAPALCGRVAIDLGGVRRYSSAGVREWIHFVRSLPSEAELALVGCSTASVTQLNLIDNFRGPARVESFWAPYACPNCSAEREVLLEARVCGNGSPGSSPGRVPAPPAVPCLGCGQPMVLNELPQHYLLFLADRPVRLAERAVA